MYSSIFVFPTDPCLSRTTWLSGKRIYLPKQELQETLVRSLGPENPLEKEMAIHSSTLAWRTPWTEEPGGLYSMGSQRVGRN